MRKSLSLFICGCLCLGFAVSVAAQGIICIDPGHGGSDPGAVGNGLQEKNINLDVAKRLHGLLQNGWRPHLTRSGDQTVSLASRASYANSLNAQRFISIHCNACNQSAHGTETFCYTSGSGKSFAMRDAVNPRVVQALNTYNRGCKTANFYVLKYTSMPAILCELAFIDNPGDAAKLGDPYYRQKAAEAIKQGLTASWALEGETPAENFYIAPRWSPDGSQILVSGRGFRGIYVFSGSDARALCEEAGAGCNARWISEDEIEYSVTPEEIFCVSTDGVATRSPGAREDVCAVAEEGRIWIVRGDARSPVSGEGDVFYHPVLSPDKKKVVYEGLSSGIWVSDVGGNNLLSVGRGNNPTWTPDGKCIVFDRTRDNGQEITAGDIWIFSVESPAASNLTADCTLVAQRPCVSPDGKQIAFDAQGRIYVADCEPAGLRNAREISIAIEKRP